MLGTIVTLSGKFLMVVVFILSTGEIPFEGPVTVRMETVFATQEICEEAKGALVASMTSLGAEIISQTCDPA